MKTNKLILTIGIPASGKSTWAREQLNLKSDQLLDAGLPYIKDDHIFITERDMFRNYYRNNGSTLNNKQLEKTITKEQEELVRDSLSEGLTVIVSDTNLNEKTVNRFRNIAKELEVEIEINDSFLNTPLETCIQRDKKRFNKVGKDVIIDKYFKYVVPNLYKHDNRKPNCNKAIICDLDGTLAIHNGRSPYDYSKVKEDIVCPLIDCLLFSMHYGGWDIIFVSGREATKQCYKDTLEWLSSNRICSLSGSDPFNPKFLHMRKEGDRRPDYEVKREIFMEHIDQKYNVIGVFDDRDQVVHMWRSLGLKTLQVDFGNF